MRALPTCGSFGETFWTGGVYVGGARVEADPKLRAGVEVAGAIVETAKEGAAASVSQNLHRQLINFNKIKI